MPLFSRPLMQALCHIHITVLSEKAKIIQILSSLMFSPKKGDKSGKEGVGSKGSKSGKSNKGLTKGSFKAPLVV